MQRSSSRLCGLLREPSQGLRVLKSKFASKRNVSPSLVRCTLTVTALVNRILTGPYYRIPIIFTPLACSAYNLQIYHTSNGSVPGSTLLVNVTVVPRDIQQSVKIMLVESSPPYSFFLTQVGPPPPMGTMFRSELVIPVDAPVG